MTIAIDFDGTIVTHAYPAIGKPIPFAIETLKKLQQEDHHQLILWTCREGGSWVAKVKYNNEALWEAKKAGIVGGLSIQCTGHVNEETGEITDINFGATIVENEEGDE